MRPLWGNTSTPVRGFAAFLFALFLGYAGNSAAAPPPNPPNMTIKIFNDTNTNTPPHYIFPVLSAGAKSGSDMWLQAGLLVLQSQVGVDLYPRGSQFRFYINPTGGIAPGQSVTITLPLYSQLVPTGSIDPTQPDQFIDWWQGGRIEIFESLTSTPPAAITADYNGTNLPARENQKPVSPVAFLPSCVGCEASSYPFKIFSDTASLGNNEPSQLTEYTLGAVNPPNPKDNSRYAWVLDSNNVDFDVSYVDAAFLPAAMEPFNNPGNQTGYVGTPIHVETFTSAIQSWLSNPNYKGWPQLKDDQGTTNLKIPSAIHIFGANVTTTPPTYDPNLSPPPPWAPITQMQNNWVTCTTGGTASNCPMMRDVNALFRANYNQYSNSYRNPTFGCNVDGQHPDPLTPLTTAAMLRNAYGWSPFNDYCLNPAFNLLQNTPNAPKPYQTVKHEFDTLQYDGIVSPIVTPLEFDPYVTLIHGAAYIAATNVYAYSVDDAVGNMQATGNGMIIDVGDKTNLPNPDPATPPLHVNYGGFTCQPGVAPQDCPIPGPGTVYFNSYGVCTATPMYPVNSNFYSIPISATNPKTCPLFFLASNNKVPYTFTITSPPPYSTKLGTDKPIDCSGNTGKALTWCKQIYAYTVPGGQTNMNGTMQDANYVILPGPEL